MSIIELPFWGFVILIFFATYGLTVMIARKVFGGL